MSTEVNTKRMRFGMVIEGVLRGGKLGVGREQVAIDGIVVEPWPGVSLALYRAAVFRARGSVGVRRGMTESGV